MSGELERLPRQSLERVTRNTLIGSQAGADLALRTLGVTLASPAGTITVFSHPGISWPLSMTTGPDENLWFTNWGSNSIGRITTDGAGR